MTGVRRDGERGSATAFALVVIGLLMLVGCAVGVVAGLVIDHRKAQAAADLAALAAAAALQEGGDACAAGAEVAADNGAEQTSCAVEGEEVVVETLVDGPSWLGWSAGLPARARAGPASP